MRKLGSGPAFPHEPKTRHAAIAGDTPPSRLDLEQENGRFSPDYSFRTMPQGPVLVLAARTLSSIDGCSAGASKHTVPSMEKE
jgi:hypothetical protein